MNRNEQAGVVYYTFESLTPFGEIVHGITARRGGVSTGAWSSLNLTKGNGDDPEHVEENLRRVAAALGTERGHLVSPNQRHTANAALASAGDRGRIFANTDTLLTDEADVPILLRYADCTPVLLYDPGHHTFPSNGKLAMRFEEGSEDRLIGVGLLDSGDDVLLATRNGKAIRFAADEVRQFTSRTSTGVRGMTLKGGDEVVSLSILHRVGTDAEERESYLRFAPWKAEKDGQSDLDESRFAELAEREQFILTVCANGYGKLSSAYEYRRTGRGGQGITNIDNIKRNGPVVASFSATQADQLMLVTDQAKLIRIGLESLRVIGRASAGVRLFDVADNEHVVSAVRIDEQEAPENDAEEAIVEEMVRRDSPETEIPDTPDRDEPLDSEE